MQASNTYSMTTPSLRQYIDSRRTTAADWNLTGMGSGWTGKYLVPDEEYETFLTLAHSHVFEKGRPHSLLEKHRAQSPILIDLDFKYASGGPLRRRFTDEQVRDFVAAYIDAVSYFFEPLQGPVQFFVMLKPAAESDTAHDEHKDGIHIECPSIITTPEIQYAIRGYLLQKGVIDTIFRDTGMTNPPQDCFDLSVVHRNNWFLYGACKPDKAWYKVEHVYSYTIPTSYEPVAATMLEEESLDQWSTLDLMKLLSIRYQRDHPTELTLRTEGQSETQWLQLLQRWGKGSNWAKPKSPGLHAKQANTATATDMPDLSLNAADDMIQISGLSVRTPYSDTDIELAYRLIRECLDPVKRAKNYHDWVALGILLHNISATEKSRDVWAAFSRRVPGNAKTSDSIYTEKWNLLPADSSAIQKGRKMLMMGTLHLWAKLDSHDVYNNIIKEANIEMALLNSSGTHDTIANMVLHMYREEFRCTPPKKGATVSSFEWYQYEKHAWRSLMTWTTLRSRLGNQVRDIYLKLESRLAAEEAATMDTTVKECKAAQKKNILKIEAQLQTTGFKECVMKEATDKFYDEDFLKQMNQDPTLVGFDNGILELRSPGADGRPHVKFRPGRPDDCVSFQMGRGMVGLDAIPYIPYDPTNPSPEHLEVLDFFQKIYPDPILREYALTLYSACLEGANHEQKFYIMSGSGGNGKSKIIDLMGKTFGEYQDSLSATALTRKRADAGNANPEFIDLKAKRFVSMVEPEEGEKINTSLMKQLSGQDMLKVRGLYRGQEGFIFTARIFMSCNELPAVSSMDNGTWRRLRVIPHVSTFVEEDKPTNPAANIHARDPLLDSKIARWRPYFASILVWYYDTKYLREGLKEPAQVTAASMKYKEENDSFAAFCQECLIRETGAELRANDALVRYKEWCKYNPTKKVMQKKDVLQKMAELYGNPIESAGKIFIGVRIIEEGEDISGNIM
jgi:P4 family phage/plasmid primase-like protien